MITRPNSGIREGRETFVVVLFSTLPAAEANPTSLLYSEFNSMGRSRSEVSIFTKQRYMVIESKKG